MAKCRGCGAEIIWIQTQARKRMPCDPEQVTYWAGAGRPDKIVTPNGEVLSCDLSGDPQTATGIGYIPHWATCPERERFRRKKGGGGDA